MAGALLSTAEAKYFRTDFADAWLWDVVERIQKTSRRLAAIYKEEVHICPFFHIQAMPLQVPRCVKSLMK